MKMWSMIVVLSALIVPCTVEVSLADEPKADSQASCQCTDCKCADGDTSNCQCTDCKCGESECTEGKCAGKCTKCKCENCENASCDKENCTCDESSKSACDCTDEGCSSCDQKSDVKATLASATSSKGECSSGECCKGSCHGEGVACNGKQCCDQAWCCNQGKCCKGGECCENGGCTTSGQVAGCNNSALQMAGQFLDVAFPTHTAPEVTEMWQRVAAEFDGCSGGDLYSEGAETNPVKKAVMLLLNDGNGGDYVIQSDCGEDTTIGSVLQGAVLPHPVNFASAQIQIRRAKTVTRPDQSIEIQERVLPVSWDPATGEPTKCTNHTLEPNDRVFVRVNAATEDRPEAVAAAYTQPLPARYDAQPMPRVSTASKPPAQIQYSIQIVEDCEGCMSEYEALDRGAPMMFAESKTLLPAMRVLQKHQLIRQLSTPRLICTAGETAEMEIGSETPKKWEGLRLEVATQQVGDSLKVELAMHASQDERNVKVCTALVVEPGQSIVLNANAAPVAKDKSSSAKPAVYVVVTPEIVE